MAEQIKHPFPPLYDENSKILILGSFPSVKSREQSFFYGHPQNRFWRVVSTVFGCETPETIEEKKCFLHSNHIALWDVIASCKIEGSADSSITNVVPNDLRPIIDGSRVERIFVNGRTAEKFYNKYTREVLGRDAVYLPSTSPANAAKSLDRLVAQWREIAEQ
ncbi:MAG: DNA-deoxyinosine glycosylase [Clostridia bacterium]|nr:DNA-deoxyinosine glycosylase [Clostridia bacterium]